MGDTKIIYNRQKFVISRCRRGSNPLPLAAGVYPPVVLRPISGNRDGALAGNSQLCDTHTT